MLYCQISAHSSCLAAELVHRLGRLTHDNGKPVVQIYGQWNLNGNGTIRDDDTTRPGPTIAFNIIDHEDRMIGYDEISRLASLNRPPLQLRTGCFCNPGACQDALLLSDSNILESYDSGHVCGDSRGIVNGRATGCIRASFGKDSLWEDMDSLVSFIGKVFTFRGNMSSNEDCSHYQTNNSDNTSAMIIGSLFVFPVKSCGAMRVTRWPINVSTGRLLFDREFALVDTSGAALRLHGHPKMSQISPSIDLVSNEMTLSAPEHQSLVISLEQSDSTSVAKDVEVCGVLCNGNLWGGTVVSKWFTSVLGIRCWLVRYASLEKSASPVSVNSKRLASAYSNEASLLLLSQRSISILNSVISSQGWGRLVEERHFRPNIVVSSREKGQEEAPPSNQSNPEDSWERISIASKTSTKLELVAVGKCARCQMVDIDPSSGMKGNTLRALAQYRRDRGRINFGTFFTGSGDPADDVVWLEEGDEVRPVY